MSEAIQRNAAAANRERERRLAATFRGEMPIGSLAVTGDQGWDAFWGSLADKREAANAAGMGFRGDLSGIGRWAGGDEPAQPSANQINYGLGRLADENAARQLALQDYAQKKQAEAVDDMRRSYDEHVLASVGQPRMSTAKAVQTTDANGRPVYTLRADEREAAQTPRERLIAGVPGSMRPQVDAALSPLSQRDRALDIEEERVRAGENNGPLVAVMGPNGQSILVPRQVAVGMRPASSREQGRPVTSGDAGRITDLKSSLDDLKVLRESVKDPGTVARIQAWMPTFVSELTGGWSDDAKQQNAVIARVRQVIGKALEGGVLRKEDEDKYRQILPVIGDSKEVATSKINGLESALNQRMGTTLDSLQDAGYDVSQFRQRPGGGNTVKLRAPDGSVRDVPADQAEHYLSKGATRVQ